jgi:hypothetical protein
VSGRTERNNVAIDVIGCSMAGLALKFVNLIAGKVDSAK